MAQAMIPTGDPNALRVPPPSLDEVAKAFPNLEILNWIGSGGMGSVFCARQPKLNRLVALKLLPAALANRDPAFAERFEREGQLLARLHHPNIVAVYDSGQAGDYFYLLMEYVDGVNLRQAMKTSRFTPEQAFAIIPRICDALQFAHEEGVLHRDIKPENILLDAKGRVKLVDFGVGKMLEGTTEPDHATGLVFPSGPALTEVGTSLGTPQYMAPEQRHSPDEVDHRADLYSLGVVFYEMLTGALPAGSFPPPSLLSPADPRIDAIVRQALQEDRDQRQESAKQIRTQVETVAQGGRSGSETPEAEPTIAPVGKTIFSMRTRVVGTLLGLIAIFALVVAPPTRGLHAMVWGVLVASVCGLILPIPWRRPVLARNLWTVVLSVCLLTLLVTGSIPIPPRIAQSPESSNLPPIPNEPRSPAVDALVPPGGTDGKATPRTWVAAYPGGTLELVAIRRNPSDPGTSVKGWWDPAGGETSFPDDLVSVPNERPLPGQSGYQVLVRPQSLLPVGYLWPPFRMPSLSTVEGNVVSISRPPTMEETSVEFWLGLGPWRKEWVKKVSDSMESGSGWIWREEGEGSVVLEVKDPPESSSTTEYRWVVFDQAGREHVSWRSEQRNSTEPRAKHPYRSHYFGGAGAPHPEEGRLRLSQLREFQLQSRAGSRLVFHQVSLRPGRTTTVAAHFEPAPAIRPAEGWSPDWSASAKPDLLGVLNEASTLARAGRHPEALQRLVWFHRHALEFDPSFSGVRLSFALSQWADLATRYPAAKVALEVALADAVRPLESGEGSVALFAEAQAIQRYLGRPEETLALFQRLGKSAPRLAVECYPWVEEALLERGDYSICAAYVPDVQARWLQIRRALEMSLSSKQRDTADQGQTIRNQARSQFAQQVNHLIEILVAQGRRDEAQQLQERAIRLNPSPELQSALEDATKRVASRQRPPGRSVF